MFKKLRNKFILTNLITTTVVLILAFGAIYFTAVNNAMRRGPAPVDSRPEFSQETNQNFNKYLDERLAEERETAQKELLASLIITGVCVEVIVAIISLILANQSIRPVKQAYLAQKDFIANASHEIKTPLAVIQANLEAADIKDNQWIDNITIKTQELTDLNNQLLALARIEAHTAPKSIEKVNLHSFIQEQLLPLNPQIEKKGITTRVTNKCAKEITVNSSALKQIINILLDNAIKYSDKKISININNTEISIKNDGATIDKDKISQIFERFYQTDKTKSGVGLGLAIAKKVADENHWDLSAASNHNSTTFTLKLKK